MPKATGKLLHSRSGWLEPPRAATCWMAIRRRLLKFLRVAALALLWPSAASVAGQDPAHVPLLADQEAWDKLPPLEEAVRQPLPAWARALAGSLPRTTAAMLELDRLHRTRNPLGPLLAGKLRLAAARANRCTYSAAYAEADLRRAGLDDAALAALAGDRAALHPAERLALEFAEQLTVDGNAVTDAQVARLQELYGERDLVAIVLLVAHANFQDRLFLALGITVEPGGPLAPFDGRFVTGKAANGTVAPARIMPDGGMPPAVADPVNDPLWQAIDFDGLQRHLQTQRLRAGRIRVPTWQEVAAALPAGKRPTRPLRIRWSLVCRGYQAELAAGWSACTGAFADEARQDRVFEESLFWIITRAIDCFY